jgi:hypothetical protein
VQVVDASTTRSLNLAPFVGGPAEAIWGIGETGGGSNNALFNPPTLPPVGERELTGVERGGFGDRLILLNNFWPTGAVQESVFQFRYVSYALWRKRDNIVVLPFRNDLHIFGYPSTSAQVATTETKSYASVVRVRILTVTNSLAAGNYTDEDAYATAVTTVNFVAGTVDVQFALSVERNNTTVFLGTVRGAGLLAADRAKFSGNLTSPDSSLLGQFSGSFFGPAGQELGLVLGLNGPVLGASPAAEQRIVGALLGK